MQITLFEKSAKYIDLKYVLFFSCDLGHQNWQKRPK